MQREARQRSTSVSAVARDVLGKHFGLDGGRRELSFIGIGDSGGKAPKDFARNMEKYLGEMVDERMERKLGRDRHR
jgi:hypothetical protein